MTWHRPHATAVVIDEDTVLCSRPVAALMLSVHPDTVKRRFQAFACDVRTRAVLVAITAPPEPDCDTPTNGVLAET